METFKFVRQTSTQKTGAKITWWTKYSLGKQRRAKVVDVGGGEGHIAIYLAIRFGDLEFVDQDMGKMIENAEVGLTAELKGRVRFMEHDLWALQTVQAGVLLFHWIFYNWSDKYCVDILRANSCPETRY